MDVFVALVLVLIVPVGLLILNILANYCLPLFKSEAVQVDAPAAAVIAPKSCDHRTDPSLTISRTHPAVF